MEQILLIDWVDSYTINGWTMTSDCKAEILLCQSVGFKVDETEDAICIALNKATKDGFRPYGELMSIPKVAIKGMKVIRVRGK